jgi:hypothetical protein
MPTRLIDWLRACPAAMLGFYGYCLKVNQLMYPISHPELPLAEDLPTPLPITKIEFAEQRLGFRLHPQQSPSVPTVQLGLRHAIAGSHPSEQHLVIHRRRTVWNTARR